MISLFRSSVKSILSLLLLVLSTLPASADRFQYGDLWFETTSENTCAVTSLDSNPFGSHYAFTEISIPELAVYNGQSYTVTTIGDYAFYECSRLTSIEIPSSVTTIGNSAFDWSSLTSIDIPSSVTTIGNSAFHWCWSLTSIDIPSSVTTIGNSAFSGCSLTSIDIPSSVTTIGESAFAPCKSLTSIDVDASNTAYTSVDGVLFDKDVTTIVAYPAGKTGNSYSIPNSVTTIGGYAFGACGRLTSIDIPSSVTTIRNGAFWCSSLTSIDIPSSVTTIGNSAFAACSSLTSIAIPNSVTTIGDGAFSYCSSLTDIYNYALVPQAISYYIFNGVSSSATLHVVKGYKDVYEAAEGWNQFYVVDDLELPTAIGSVTTGAPATSIYTLDGRRADHTAKGIGIVRTADGKTRKVMTK